jgi:hypothetical protein
MTDFTRYQSSRRDQQDHVERGVWGGAEDVPGAGQMMRVRGTGTEDLEVPILSLGFSFNLVAGDANAEVVMLSLGSDVNDKVALPCIPRDQAFQWPAGTGGIQHPTDPERRIEFNDTETHHTDGRHAFGPNKELVVRVDGGKVFLEVNGPLTISAGGAVEITSPTLTHNGVNVGDTHTHPGVDPGPANTGTPQ